MAKCIECGIAVGAGAPFCGACGTHQPVTVEPSKNITDLEMGGESEQETLDNVVVEKKEKQTGELSKAAAASMQ